MIHLGYEVGTGEPVAIPLHHLVVAGITRLAGKTTTLEALISRSGLRGLVFRTKRGELGFKRAHEVRPHFVEHADWQYVEALIGATLREKASRFERSYVINLCRGAHRLRDIYERAIERRDDPKTRAIDQGVYTNLAAYLELVLPQIEGTTWARSLELAPGLNMMDLSMFSAEMQQLIVRATLETIFEGLHDVVVVVPEAQDYIPEARMTPVKAIAEDLVRKGASVGNFLWLDGQTVTGISKSILKQCDIWVLGRQREINEARRTVDQIPIPAGQRPKSDRVMSLPVGHFFACFGTEVHETYVQPSWASDEDARQVAMGVRKTLSLPATTDWVASEVAVDPPPRSAPDSPETDARANNGVSASGATFNEEQEDPEVIEELEAKVRELQVTLADAETYANAKDMEVADLKQEVQDKSSVIGELTRANQHLAEETRKRLDHIERGPGMAAARFAEDLRELIGLPRELPDDWSINGHSVATATVDAEVLAERTKELVINEIFKDREGRWLPVGAVQLAPLPAIAETLKRIQDKAYAKEVEKVLNDIRSLPPLDRQVLGVFEHEAKNLTIADIVRALGRPASSGSAHQSVSRCITKLLNGKWVYKASGNNGFKGRVRIAIDGRLLQWEPSADDVDVVYQHIMAIVAEALGAEAAA